MLSVTVLCVGKMREKHFISAFSEYEKRLGAFCRFELQEIAEQRLPDKPGDKEIAAALEKEAAEILKAVPADAWLCALCVEGKQLSSPDFAAYLSRLQNSGVSHICFLVGGSFGLHERVKQAAGLRLSMSEMTFPHHLARIILAEQVYRAFKILEGSRYHK